MDDDSREADWIAALRAGDEAAFEELVRRHGPRMRVVARRILRNEEDTRECLQEAFLSAHRGLGQFGERARIGTWLHRIVVNAALMKLRARRSRPEGPIDDFAATYDRFGFREGPRSANELNPEELLARDDTRKQVHDAIGRLPEIHRTVLLLRDIEGFDTRETAVLLGIEPGSVKVRLHRARNALAKLLRGLFDEESHR